jgi:hypothetical protein
MIYGSQNLNAITMKSKRQYQKEPGRGCGCPNKAYEFESPGQLMEDFWKDVNEIVGK